MADPVFDPIDVDAIGIEVVNVDPLPTPDEPVLKADPDAKPKEEISLVDDQPVNAPIIVDQPTDDSFDEDHPVENP